MRNNMLHIDSAKKAIKNRDFDAASDIINNLLVLAPKNTNILKLKSYIARIKCKFDEELEIWRKIGQIDHFDEDVQTYFELRALEERERLFFTKSTSNLGKLFVAIPNTILWFSTYGFFGCILFLTISQFFLTKLDPDHYLHTISLTFGFIMFVVLPWFFIIKSFLTSLKSVEMNYISISFHTRFKEYSYLWEEIKRAVIEIQSTFQDENLSIDKQKLYLQISDNKWIKIDLTPNKSVIRVNKQFIALFQSYFKGKIEIYTDPNLKDFSIPDIVFRSF